MHRTHPTGRMSALTGRLASPFFHPIDRSESSVHPINEPAPRNSGTSAPQTNREVSDSAARKYRIFW